MPMSLRGPWSGVSFVIVFVLLVAAFGSVPAAAAETYRIGTSLVLEGTAAEYGVSNLRGVQIAVDQINAAGGIHGRMIELVIEDTHGEPSQAAAVLRKFASDPTVLAVIGPVRSPELLAQSPVAGQLEIILMSPGSVLLWPEPWNPWTFRSTMPDFVGVPPLVRQVAEEWESKTAAMLYAIDDDWSVGSMEQFAQAAEANGIDLLATEGFRTNDTDFSAQLTRIVRHRPDVIFLPVLARDAALIMQQARRIGIQADFVGLSAFNDPHIMEVAAREAQGAVFATPFDPNDPREVVQTFVKTYTEQYGEDVPLYAAYGYDAMLALADALARAGDNPTRDSLRIALGTASGIDGVTGVFGYDGPGDALKDVVNFLQIHDGHYRSWP